MFAKCLQSVCSQTYLNLDIIIVDDGSTDESLKIALEFAKKDARIFIISKPNGGLSSARNMGLEFIKGNALRSYFEQGLSEKIKSFRANSFDKDFKEIEPKEIDNFFTQLHTNYIQTTLENINDFITSKLPPVFIHFVDSDDYLEKDCIEICLKKMLEKNIDICPHYHRQFLQEEKCFSSDTQIVFFI